MGSYKRFPVGVWSLFEELLKTRLTGIKGKLAELELKVKKVAASEEADKLTTAYSIDGVDFDGSGDINHYGICSTVSSDSTKVVSCAGFKLKAGSEITVRFDNADTSSDVTVLNVNNTGGQLVKYNGVTLPDYAILENSTHTFKYNGNWFDLVGSLGKIYEPFDPATEEIEGSEGLVPAPEVGKDGGYFLNALGAWAIPHDTTYSVFGVATNVGAGSAGLVPAPKIGNDDSYFLTAAATWVQPPSTVDFVAATEENNGTHGLVPAPGAGDDSSKFLNASGGWSVPPNTTYSIFTAATAENAGTAGLVPGPGIGTSDTTYLNALGGWSTPPNTTYTIFGPASVSANGTAGLVPAPAIGDGTSKFLNALGAWLVPPTATTTTAGYMSAEDKTNLNLLFYQSSKVYSEGDQVHVAEFPSYMILECITAGTTDSSRPDFATYAAVE